MKIPTPHEIKAAFPLSRHGQEFIDKSRQTAQDILDRKDPRKLAIIGPCSIHSLEEGLAFAEKLKTLQSDEWFFVTRANIEKPRTGLGWRGLAHDPYLNASFDFERGLTLSRHLLTELAEREVPVAMEFLTPHLLPYFEELVTWGWIGARTASSQLHRLLASHLPMPVGIKNTTDGNINIAIQGVHVARHPQTFLHTDDHNALTPHKSLGNPYAHVVLRGSNRDTNYDPASIQQALELHRKHELPLRIIVDCSHGNASGKCFSQKEVFEKVVAQDNPAIVGIMLECHLNSGTQKIPSQLDELQPGVSITDPCLDFASAEELFVQSALISAT